MAYQDIVEMQGSQELMLRVSACAAGEGEAAPQDWVAVQSWALAAQPGWADAWSYAREQGIEAPERGRSDTVITDAMILSAVQVLLQEQV
jgi:hypothetical protein